jgi:hypothetical protein
MTEQQDWTPEPWKPCGLTQTMFPRGIISECGTCQLVAEVNDAWVGLPFAKGTPEGNARRICAAVNAVAGVSTQALEPGMVRDLVLDLDEARRLTAELLAALEDVRPWIAPGGERLLPRIDAALAKARPQP